MFTYNNYRPAYYVPLSRPKEFRKIYYGLGHELKKVYDNDIVEEWVENLYLNFLNENSFEFKSYGTPIFKYYCLITITSRNDDKCYFNADFLCYIDDNNPRVIYDKFVYNLEYDFDKKDIVNLSDVLVNIFSLFLNGSGIYETTFHNYHTFEEF